MLAGAAWTLDNWAALEEFATKKRGRSEKQKDRNGRCDLYLCTRDRHFAFEAKLAWQTIGEGRQSENVRKELKRAWNDAGDLDIEEGDCRIAATFVVPRVLKAKARLPPQELRGIVEDWLSGHPFDFTGRPAAPTPDALAYVFPGRFENFVGARNGHVFPGVALALYVRQRANKGVHKTSSPD
jgi:hypothetical protein